MGQIKCNLIPPGLQLGTRKYLVLSIFVRMIFIWSEFLLSKLKAAFFSVLFAIDQITSWKEMKEAFSVKLQTENLCFCLRWKLSKVQPAQIKNKNVVFKNFHQNIKPICTNGHLFLTIVTHIIWTKIWKTTS